MNKYDNYEKSSNYMRLGKDSYDNIWENAYKILRASLPIPKEVWLNSYNVIMWMGSEIFNILNSMFIQTHHCWQTNLIWGNLFVFSLEERDNCSWSAVYIKDTRQYILSIDTGSDCCSSNVYKNMGHVKENFCSNTTDKTKVIHLPV